MKRIILDLRTLCIAVVMLATAPATIAVQNDGSIPILTYHSWDNTGCTANTNTSLALARDLEILHQKGFVVVPVYWIAQWAIGDRDGSTLPSKPVGLTFDDGTIEDWYDTVPNGCLTKSLYRVLQDFKNAHPSLPPKSPHASSFVIASPVARSAIGGNNMLDDWWYSAQHSGLMEIYNHSLDHDHDSIHGPLLDSDPHFVSQAPFQAGAYISAGGYYDFNWVGAGTFARILDYNSATAEVTLAGKYIEDKIDAYPDLFAYPYGAYNAYLVDTFFPTYPSQHQTYAAFTTEKLWVSRTANRWKLGRFVRGRDWVTGPELEAILDSPPPPGC